VVRLLVERGADALTKNIDGCTPGEQARVSREIMSLLQEAAAERERQRAAMMSMNNAMGSGEDEEEGRGVWVGV
jgi:hypothetical protein